MTRGNGSRLADLGYRAGWRLARSVPEPLAARAFDFGADRAARGGGPAAAQLRCNLARVVPGAPAEELDQLVRRGLRSYARYWREAFRLPSMDHAALHARLDRVAEGAAHLDAALAAGRGVVVVLSHSGNWDMAGVWLVGRSGEFSTVAERLRPEALYQQFEAYRRSLGFDVVPLTGEAQSPTLRLARRLRSGGVVCLLADRDLTDSGVTVELFGAPARFPSGPARLAAATGAALLPAGCWFAPDGWGLRLHPPVPVHGRSGVPGATQAVADRFAADIAEHPEDWHMLQPLWLADLPTATAREG
ncbi:MAG TPA: phosphatidylinositol mannoside acyltransferase [Pseudonocardiaceae bacterium]|nr:phosphatidylinositol mannoside acyltransferase [Pseudonocardiaceae bacterium]